MFYVYKYKDLDDGVVKYIGITDNLDRRISQHKKEGGFLGHRWDICYLQVPTKSDAESLEAHFIAVYNTHLFLNKAKAQWGQLSFYNDQTYEWKPYSTKVLQKSKEEIIDEMWSKYEKHADAIEIVAPGFNAIFDEFFGLAEFYLTKSREQIEQREWMQKAQYAVAQVEEYKEQKRRSK